MRASRAMVTANCVVIAVVAVPLVWVIGYQDHRWRSTELATLAALLLLGASVLLVRSARAESPPVSSALPWIAVGMSAVALGLARAWGWLG